MKRVSQLFLRSKKAPRVVELHYARLAREIYRAEQNGKLVWMDDYRPQYTGPKGGYTA